MDLSKACKKHLAVVKMSDLKPYPGNPRRNNKSAVIVSRSIGQYGYINPIIVTSGLMILAGHTRFKALKILGYESVEVLVVEGLTQQQIDGFVIADNRVGEYSQWNYSQIDRLLTEDSSDAFINELGMTSFTKNKEALEDLING